MVLIIILLFSLWHDHSMEFIHSYQDIPSSMMSMICVVMLCEAVAKQLVIKQADDEKQD